MTNPEILTKARSIDTMTLQDLATQLPRLQAECKDLWPGESNPGEIAGSRFFDGIPFWEMHLKEMVVAEDPIKYLGDNI